MSWSPYRTAPSRGLAPSERTPSPVLGLQIPMHEGETVQRGQGVRLLTRFLSPEGLFSLDLSTDWRLEQTSEDGSFVFHRPAGQGLLRIAESARRVDDHKGVGFPDQGESMQTADLDALLPHGQPCLVNGFEARVAETVRGSEVDSGDVPASFSQRSEERPRRVRQWVVADGSTVVHVTYEGPPQPDEAEDEAVDRVVGTLVLRREPHPAVASLLQRLHDQPDVRTTWLWHPQKPLVIVCVETGQEVGLEAIVRGARSGSADRVLEEQVRRIRNLQMRSLPFAAVADDILPLVRTAVLREEVESRGGTRRPAVCGEDRVRRPFAPGLYVYYGVDVPGAFQFVTPALAATWGVRGVQLENRAIENLRRKTEGERLDFLAVGGHRIVVMEDGEGLAASRLLLASFRKQLALRLGHGYRIALPSAGVLIAFSRELVEWREFLGEDVWDAYMDEPVAITGQIYESAGEGLFVPVH